MLFENGVDFVMGEMKMLREILYTKRKMQVFLNVVAQTHVDSSAFAVDQCLQMLVARAGIHDANG